MITTQNFGGGIIYKDISVNLGTISANGQIYVDLRSAITEGYRMLSCVSIDNISGCIIGGINAEATTPYTRVKEVLGENKDLGNIKVRVYLIKE